MITGKGMATTNAVQGKLIRLLSKYSNGSSTFTACSSPSTMWLPPRKKLN